MSCSRTQHLVLAGIELPLSGLIQQTTNSLFFLLPRKQDLTFLAMETICMKCQILFSWTNKKNISNCHLLKILPRVLSIKVCTKQIAHESVHGKTYNKTRTKRGISLHTEPAHQ